MKVLIAYDGSTSADAAIGEMRRAGLPDRVEGLIVCATEGTMSPPDDTRAEEYSESWRDRLGDAEQLAETARNRICSSFPLWTVSVRPLWGSAAKVILDTCASWEPDLLIVGSHGRSRISRLFLGSVSLELIHKAPCSVRVTRAAGSPAAHPTRMIIGHDGSLTADTAIRSIASREWPEGTEAQIVAVVQTLAPATARTALNASTFREEPAYSVILDADERERTRLRNVAEYSVNSLRHAGLVVSSTIVDGDPRDVILAAADAMQADTIVVGARGLGRLDRLLLGSVSTHIVLHAHCTVEVVRTPA